MKNLRCDKCGHIETVYTHSLNAPMVSALRQLVDFYDKKGKPANLQNDLDLTKNQYNNFQKLKHFRLVARTTDGWVPTKFGTEFIFGEAMSPKWVATISNERIEFGDDRLEGKTAPMVSVKEVDFSSYRYKQREAYVSEKLEQLSII